MISQNLELAQDQDYNQYRIPIYIINDPIRFILSEKDKLEGKEIRLFVRFKNEMQREVVIKNTDMIRDLKKGVGMEDLRLFFRGKELENDKLVC